MDDKLKAALDKANAAVKAMTPEQRDAMWRAQRESYVGGEMALAKLEKGMTVPAPLPKAAVTVTIPAAEYEAMKTEIAEARSYLKILIARRKRELRRGHKMRDWLKGVGQGTAQ